VFEFGFHGRHNSTKRKREGRQRGKEDKRRREKEGNQWRTTRHTHPTTGRKENGNRKKGKREQDGEEEK
jgi:hypothetical protein